MFPLSVAFVLATVHTPIALAEEPAAPPPTSARVVSVYDGDTFTLETGDRVRLRWVNTPELKPQLEAYGIEARDAARNLILNQEVTLEYGQSIRDGYGRLIAGASINGVDLSAHLASLGFAHVFVIPPDDTDLSTLMSAQEKARTAGRGIWSDERYQGVLHITSFHANAPGDDRDNVNGEYLRLCNTSADSLDLQGFRISDASGRSWVFPSLILPAGHTVKVHSGVGDNQLDANSQLSIFLGNANPIWNNGEDRAAIHDPFGRLVDSREHRVKTKTKN